MIKSKEQKKKIGEIILEYNIEEDSIYHATNEATRRFGVPQKIEKVQDYMIQYGVIQPESAKDFLNLFRTICGGAPYAECVVKAKTAKGELAWEHIALTTIFDENNVPVRAMGVLKDVTEWLEAGNNYAMHQDIMMREALIYYEANLTLHKITFGIEPFLSSIGAPLTDDYAQILDLLVNTVVHPEDREAVQNHFSEKALLESYANGILRVQLEYRRLTGQGTVVWVRSSAYLTENKISKDILLYFYVSNINDMKLCELNLKERTERDGLTGIYNRVTAEIKIKEAIAQDFIEEKMGVVLSVGVSNFIEGTDIKGHYFGDALLSQIGHKLKDCCRNGDVVGRQGVNNFVLYFRALQDEEELKQRAQFLRAQIEGALKDAGAALAIGAARFLLEGDSFEILQRRANIAMNYCQQTGESFCLYSQEIHKLVKKVPEGINWADEKEFESRVSEHVFRTLYESKDLNQAIEGVLELITEVFEFHKSYVFDIEIDGAAKCIFEYRVENMSFMPEEKRTLNPNEVEKLKDIFHDKDIYIQTNESLSVGQAEVGTRVLYCCQNDGKMLGLVGFNRLGTSTEFTQVQMKALKRAIRLVGVFLTGRALNKELQESSLLLQSIVDGMNTCTYIIDPETHIIKYINQNAQEAMPGAYPGKYCYEALRARTSPCEDCPIDRMLQEGTKEDRSELYLEQFGVWAKVNASLVTMPTGQRFGVFNSFDFSNHRHESEATFDLSSFTQDTSLYDALSLSTDDHILICDMATKTFYFPKKMVDEFDLPAQIIEDAIPVWVERIHKDDREDFIRDIDAMFSGQTDTHNQEYRVKNKTGEWVWIRARGHVERNKEGEPRMFAVVLTNIGKKSKVDHLTGLLDKYEFEMSTRAQLAEGASRGVLLLLGLDNFRYINNIYGWDFGDNVLKEASLRILSTLPEGRHLYRLDGDKFGTLFLDAEVDEVEEYYKGLHNVFRQHRQFGEHRYYCTVSGGCAYFDNEDVTFSTLYKQAIFALDASKHNGKNRLTVYDAQTMSGNERMLALVASLHASVEQNYDGFELYFQPQINVKTGQVKSAEALLRWREKEFGMVSASEFIPLLEQAGLIHGVGSWVLKQASMQCAEWRKTVPDFTISVNISFMQLQHQNFLSYLETQIENGVIHPHMLHLEITESCIVDGSCLLGEAINNLRRMGFLIEMDDFGTGYSSLEILKNAPADVVKIDQVFVRDITKSKFDATFIQIIADLCHSVDIKVCLEGVETSEEYGLVQAMKVDLIQGFLFGKPQPKEEFAKTYIFGKEQ